MQVLMFLSALDVDELEVNDVQIDIEGIIDTLCERLLMRKSEIDNSLYVQIISFLNLLKYCSADLLKDIIVWAEVNQGELVIEEFSIVLSLISNVNKKDRNFVNI